MPIAAMDIATARLMLISTYRVVEKHLEWLNDKELMKWSEQRYRTHTIATQGAFLDQARDADNPLVWDIRFPPQTSARPGQSIGSLHAYYDERHRRVDLGIMLGPNYHGDGYAAEAWSAVCNYLATKHSMRKFEASFVDGNLPILKMLMRLGWRPECRREDHFIIDGESRALVMFGTVYR